MLLINMALDLSFVDNNEKYISAFKCDLIRGQMLIKMFANR